MLIVYGLQYEIRKKIHRFHILAVDYDHSLIGESLFVAYDQLKSGPFPTPQVHSVSEFPKEKSLTGAVLVKQY
jgi:hypothetical protein